jgi:hypothetical protein
VESSFILQGRLTGAAELQEVRNLLESHPEWSRYRLCRQLCWLWNWRAPNGQLKDMAARTLLLKLESRFPRDLCLPPKRRARPSVPKPVADRAANRGIRARLSSQPASLTGFSLDTIIR